MNEKRTHDIFRPATIAVVAPAWLFGPLTVFLEAMQGLELIARALTVRELLSLGIVRPPDMVLLYAADQGERACNQVQRIEAAWPAARCLALVEDSRQKELVEAVCAGEVLLKGASPKHLLAAIHRLWPTDEDVAT